MNKHLKHTLLALAASATLASAPAQAIQFVGVEAEGPVVVENYSTDGLLSFDIDFKAVTSVTLNYLIEASDLTGMGLSFNAILRNLTDSGLAGYNFSLGSGVFEEVGTVTRQFGGDSSISFNGAMAAVRFSTPEFLDVEIGDPLAIGANQIDWAIDGLSAGDRLSISVSAVPEPGSVALLLAGLGVVAWVARRRQG